MMNYANGYELAEWTNQKLNKKDILISTHRSISLFNMKTFSNIFTWHIDPKNKLSLKYANYLKSEKINRIVFFWKNWKPSHLKNVWEKNCFIRKMLVDMLVEIPLLKENIITVGFLNLKMNIYQIVSLDNVKLKV